MHRQEGRRKGDRNIGRYLADTVDAVPRLGQEELEKLCRENTQVLASCNPIAMIVNGKLCVLPPHCCSQPATLHSWLKPGCCRAGDAAVALMRRHHNVSALTHHSIWCAVQDVLLVMYLANLVRTHVALADKLGTQALPLV